MTQELTATEKRHFYILVRTDLTIPQQMCQAAHAAHEAGIHLAVKNPEISSVVICSIPTEEALLDAQRRIEGRGIQTILFREPDIGNQATALATEPIPQQLRKALSAYKLWR